VESVAAVTVPTVIGIDVGGPRKGFHAVALTAGAYGGQKRGLGFSCILRPTFPALEVSHPWPELPWGDVLLSLI
jgi:hypothetical protein